MLRPIPTVLMRGGSSKGLFFLASDLPADPAARDRLLLAAMGSPDVRQIDGLGGGDDQSSKVVIVAPSRRPGIDVEYLFAQVSVSRDVVDTEPNSGNMLSGVAPFAIGHGLVRANDGETLVRIHNRNNGRVVEALVQTPGGKVTYQGDGRMDGVPGTSAAIVLRFLDPAGGKTGKLLPTGNAVDTIDGIAVTCVDFANPVVLLAADAVGRNGHASKRELDADRALLRRLESLRQAAARKMGLGEVEGKGLPKVVLLAPPRAGGSIASRYFTPWTCHSAHAVTGALCVAAACHVPGSVAARLADPAAIARGIFVIEHPAGKVETRCSVDAFDAAGMPVMSSASVVTTARPLFTGTAWVRDQAAVAAAH